MNYLVLFVLILWGAVLNGQSIEDKLQGQIEAKTLLEAELQTISSNIENLKLQRQITELKKLGLPAKTYIEYSAMILAYSEEHEQIAWVSHIISPDITIGAEHRSNDFRVDP